MRCVILHEAIKQDLKNSAVSFSSHSFFYVVLPLLHSPLPQILKLAVFALDHLITYMMYFLYLGHVFK